MFLAAQKVGPTDKAVGIDMTPEMLALARRNAARADGGKPMKNVEFHQATIDKLPLVSSSCCSAPTPNADLHQRLADLRRRYDVNDYAASVRVFAVKPRA